MISMKLHVLLTLLVLVTTATFGQKKVIPVTVSGFSGMTLPQGTTQDNRLLSTATAAVLLEGEAKKWDVKITAAEVLTLPAKSTGWSRGRFEELIRQAGWQIFTTDNPQFGWLVRGHEYLFYYYDEPAQRTDLYFGRPDGKPNLPSTEPTTFTQPSSQQATNPATIQNPSSNNITGTWMKSSSTSGNMAYGYAKCQYIFYDDGSYVFYAKTFDMNTPQMVLRKEKGSYVISGSTLSVTPSSSVVQTWSKKDNADKWGTMLKAQQGTPENTIYTLRFEKFGDKLNLLLSPVNGKTTAREGAFGVNSSFPNTYFYEIPPDDSYLIELPEGEKPTGTEKKNEPAVVQTVQPNSSPSQPNQTRGYTYWVTNWDDGWVSTIEEDKVVVTKGNVRVHLYYALQHDDYSRAAGRDFFWDTYLTKEFRILSKQYRDEAMAILKAPYIEGTAIDPKTGKNCFLAFYVSSGSGFMFPVVAVAPDEATIRKTFPNAHKEYDSELPGMSRYNSFAVSLSDIVGKWSGGSSAAMNLYNAYTGTYAGMSAVAMSDEFEFFPNGDYRSKHQGASGMVGTMSTYSLEYKGKATVSNWEIILPNRWEGKTSTFHAWFEAVRGGRILNLQDKQYRGSTYSLVKEQ